MTKKKPTIGLTGGVGAGKTTAARQFQKLECAVINADELNHQVLTRPEIIEQLVRWWGDAVLASDGRVNREAVGCIVFDNTQELKKLTDLVHPLIGERVQEMIESFQDDPHAQAVVLDVPLLFEAGYQKWCDYVVFVAVDEKIRLKTPLQPNKMQ